MLIITWLFHISLGFSEKVKDCEKVAFWILYLACRQYCPRKSHFLKCFHLKTTT